MLLQQNRGVLSTDVIPSNLIYSPFCKSIWPPSKIKSWVRFFTFTFPCSLEESVTDFVSNSFGWGWSSLVSFLSFFFFIFSFFSFFFFFPFSIGSFNSRKLLSHLGQSLSFGYGATILYPQWRHSIAAFSSSLKNNVIFYQLRANFSESNSNLL